MVAENKELKPCPFCGGEATIEGPSQHSSEVGIGYMVYCVNDECYLGIQDAPPEYRFKSDAIEAWNKRYEQTCCIKDLWLYTDNVQLGRFKCTYCGEDYIGEPYQYCPNCGAKVVNE